MTAIPAIRADESGETLATRLNVFLAARLGAKVSEHLEAHADVLDPEGFDADIVVIELTSDDDYEIRSLTTGAQYRVVVLWNRNPSHSFSIVQEHTSDTEPEDRFNFADTLAPGFALALEWLPGTERWISHGTAKPLPERGRAGMPYVYSDATDTETDAGDGRVWVDHATPASVTELAISKTDRFGAARGPSLLAVTVGAEIEIGSVVAGDYATYRVTGTPGDETDFVVLPVEHVDSSGTLADGSEVNLLKGAPGDPGADGTDPGPRYEFDTGTADENPGAGIVRADNADLSAADHLYLSDTDADANGNAGALIQRLQASTNVPKGRITLKARGGNEFAAWDVLGVEDETGWRTVTLQSATHVGVTSFSDEAELIVTIDVFGDKGGDGSNGTDGTDPGYPFEWDTGTTEADPGLGIVRLNHATLGSVTKIIISGFTAAATNPNADFLPTWDDHGSADLRGRLLIKNRANEAEFVELLLSGSITAQSGGDWYEMAATATGTGISDEAAVSVQFTDAGPAGAGAVSSVNGATGDVTLEADDIATTSGGTFEGDDIETVLDDHEGRIGEAEGDIAAIEGALPTGDVVGTTDAQTLTGKTIDGDDNTITDIGTSSLKTKTGADAAVVTGTAGTNGHLASWNSDGDAVGSGIPASTVLVDGDVGSVVNAHMDTVGQAEAEAGTATTRRAWTAQRVAQAIAALGSGGSTSLGAVGTYAFLEQIAGTNAIAPGDTAAGSGFTYSNASGGTGPSSPSGTWRCMGDIPSSGTNNVNATLFVRIS